MEKEQIKELKTKIAMAVAVLTPFLKDIAEEKIIPWVRRKYYERTETAISKMLKKLVDLGAKTINCTDLNKKTKHIIGFKLGFAFVCAIEPLIVQARQALAEINNAIEADNAN